MLPLHDHPSTSRARVTAGSTGASAPLIVRAAALGAGRADFDPVECADRRSAPVPCGRITSIRKRCAGAGGSQGESIPER